MTQVNRDNILQVRSVLKNQADTLGNALSDAQLSAVIGHCGRDPISNDATPMFNGKIADLLAVHWAHHRELTDAINTLDRTARAYGYTDEQIERALTALQAAP